LKEKQMERADLQKRLRQLEKTERAQSQALAKYSKQEEDKIIEGHHPAGKTAVLENELKMWKAKVSKIQE
jgi:hypothetical protein